MWGQVFMNYLWEAELDIVNRRIEKHNIRYYHTANGSPYMELSLDCLNQDSLDGLNAVGVNTYYRFYSIFNKAFLPESSEYKDLTESLTNLILHMLAENDVRKGMTKEEYYKKMLKNNISALVFGEDVKLSFALFSSAQQELFLSGWLRVYRSGSSLTIFTDMVYKLIDNSIVYHGADLPDIILIYTSEIRTWESEKRMKLLVDIFLDIRYQVEIFYEHHFGILGVDATMIIDEIALY